MSAISKNYEISSYGQATFQETGNRQFDIVFSEPDKGVNEETGILLLVSGYGGDLNSNVYKKMREQFADQFNLITIQCNYLGHEFMQGASDIKIDNNELKKSLTSEEFSSYVSNPQRYIQEIADKKEIDIYAEAILKEERDNFNDMGLLQAIDNLTAVKVVMDILDENKLKYNKRKIIGYGHSHGAYICYLCNMFSPNLMSTIIDNSAYLYPVYLGKARMFYSSFGKSSLKTKFSYLVNDIVLDKEIYNISKMYNTFTNKAKIICFHGEEDNMITLKEKSKFIESTENSILEAVNNENINKNLFGNCAHGLGADFIKLFEYVSEKYGFELKKETMGYGEAEYKTSNYKYKVSYEMGIPKLEYEKI